MEAKQGTENVFSRLTRLINILTDEKVFTKHDRIFIYNYVVALNKFRNNLSKEIKQNVAEFEEKFYNVIFWFFENNYAYPQIPNTDPFYPLQKHLYNLLAELNQIKEHYDVYGNTKELRNLIKPTFILITDQRKLFLEDMIALICKNYSLRVKKRKTRSNISSKVKTKIDYFFKNAIEKQHHKFFEPIESFARTTDSYVTMCKYLKILKNSVDEMCTITTDETLGNTTKTDLFDHFVPGCPNNVSKNVTEGTNETQKYLSELREPNVILSSHQRSLLTIREPNILSTNIETQGLSYGFLLCILSFSMFFIIVLKKFFCK